MTFEQAKRHLEELRDRWQPMGPILKPDGSIHSNIQYVDWPRGYPQATLDGSFTADQLEAIAVIMRAAL